VVAYHVYYPFGEEATAFNQDAVRIKFTGHERDLGNPDGAGDDLDYMHQRFCSPVTGRFLSSDIAKGRASLPQTWNRYTYSLSNPLRYADPNGQDAVDVMAGVGTGLGNFALHLLEAVAIQVVRPDAPVVTAVKTVSAATKAYLTSGGRSQMAASYKSLTTREKTAVITEAVAAGALGAVAARAIGSGSANTQLFRAVSPAESASLAASQGAFNASPTGSMMKGFFFSAADAQSFANAMTKITGETHSVVGTRAPAGLVRTSPLHSAAAEGPGVFILNENLPALSPANPVQALPPPR
jgi:RHS repeat-associated protein